MIIDDVLHALRDKVKHRVWLFSDLQQSDPVHAEYCLTTAVNDFKKLDMECDYIWYLGDAVEGSHAEHLKEMVQMQLDLLRPLKTPLRFVLGNHDFDYLWANKEEGKELPVYFYDAVREVPGWKSIDSLDSFYFTEDIGDYKIVFLSDHGDRNGEWISTHGRVRGDKEKYPHTDDDYLALKKEIEMSSKRIITVSHGAFPGGNRPFQLWGKLLPLPDHVKVHFYGHSHMGDGVFGKEHVYRKVSYVDFAKIPQINVSSLENRRGDEIRSVFLEIYENDTIGIYFRDHGKESWADVYMINDQR